MVWVLLKDEFLPTFLGSLPQNHGEEGSAEKCHVEPQVGEDGVRGPSVMPAMCVMLPCLRS